MIGYNADHNFGYMYSYFTLIEDEGTGVSRVPSKKIRRHKRESPLWHSVCELFIEELGKIIQHVRSRIES